MKTDQLYFRRKLAGDLDWWSESNIHGNPATAFNFKNFNFKLNGVTYRDDCPEWREAITKIQMWAQLHD